MRDTHQIFAERLAKARSAGDTEHLPYPFHPEPGGLISWGYDHGGDEHFFLPCDPDPDRWKVVTMAHEQGCNTFDGSLSDFALAFARDLLAATPHPGIDPDVLEFLTPEVLAEELAAEGVTTPSRPTFEPF
jgi:hypothetical protein